MENFLALQSVKMMMMLLLAYVVCGASRNQYFETISLKKNVKALSRKLSFPARHLSPIPKEDPPLSKQDPKRPPPKLPISSPPGFQNPPSLSSNKSPPPLSSLPKQKNSQHSTSTGPNSIPPPPKSPPQKIDLSKFQGPKCGGVGRCCSNSAQIYPSGTAMMPSMWRSSQMAHGAKIQIREPIWNTWWRPFDGKQWNGPIVHQKSEAPAVNVYFTVLRVSNTQIQLLTVDNTYVTAGPPNPQIGGNCHDCVGTMATTKNRSDPGTVLTVVPVNGSTYSVYFKCFDGYWISGNQDGYLLRWNSKRPDAWERHDIMEITSVPAIRGPNVGSWLVAEKWMVPNLYPLKMRYNDGTSVRIQSVWTKKWIFSGASRSSVVKCNKSTDYEYFQVIRECGTGGAFSFKTWWLQYWSLENNKNGRIISAADVIKSTEKFNLTFQNATSELAVILAPNGRYIRAWPSGELTADVSPSSVNFSKNSTWTSQLAFRIVKNGSVDGEFQTAKEFGPDLAAKKFRDHRDTYFTEADWVYLRSSGANAIRLTVGWWVQDKSPVPGAPGQPWPFNYNGTKYLDWAFNMAKKYGIRIFISIHGAPGSQSGWGNTGSQSGLIEWPLEKNVNATLSFVDWLCQRYVSNPQFLGISLLNEPVVWGVPKKVVQKYYMDAYKIVRSYSQCLYVSIGARVGSNEWDDVVWIMTMPEYTNVMIEVHAYNVFGGLSPKTPQEEIEWVKINRLKQIIDLQAVGRTVLIGEFSNAMYSGNVADDIQANFSKAQLQTFSKAINGWFFWSLKLAKDGYSHWSWYKSIQKGWLPKNPKTATWY